MPSLGEDFFSWKVRFLSRVLDIPARLLADLCNPAAAPDYSTHAQNTLPFRL